MKFYSRNGDDLTIGGAALTSILYGFWQDKLSNVKFGFTDYSNFSGVKLAMVEKFGPGYQANRYIESYIWGLSPTTNSAMLRYSEVTRSGSVFMSSGSIRVEQQRFNVEKAKQGAATGF